MFHKHHIIPKHEWRERFGSLKGVNCQENLTLLTVEQHAEAHRWLWEQYGRWEDYVAWKFLGNQITKEEAQREMGRQVGLSRKGIKRVFTEEHKQNLSFANKGSNRGVSKRPQTDDHRRKLSIAVAAYYAAK